MKKHNCWDRPCVYIFFKVQCGKKFKINDHPSPVQFLPLRVEGDTITQYGKAEFVFVQNYLVSDDSC